MRARTALGGLAAALALVSAAPAAQAVPRPYCADGAEIVCTVIALTCILEPGEPCHP